RLDRHDHPTCAGTLTAHRRMARATPTRPRLPLLQPTSVGCYLPAAHDASVARGSGVVTTRAAAGVAVASAAHLHDGSGAPLLRPDSAVSVRVALSGPSRVVGERACQPSGGDASRWP